MSHRLPLLLGILFLPNLLKAQDHVVFLRDLHVEAGQTRVPAGMNSIAPVPVMPFPGYPFQLLASGVIGDAEVRFFVRPDGSIGEVIVVSASRAEFGAAATKAIASWKFPMGAMHFGGTIYNDTNVWMRCRFAFRLGEDDGIPTYYPDFAHARLTGREALDLAYAAADRLGISLRSYPISKIQVTVFRSTSHLVWNLRFFLKEYGGRETIGVLVDDAARSAIVEREESAPIPTAERPTPDREEDPFVLVFSPRLDGDPETVVPVAAMDLPDYGEMMRQGVAGYATIRFRITPDGRITDSEVLVSSDRFFGDAVGKVLPQWRFQPVSGVSSGGVAGLLAHTRVDYRWDNDTHLFSGGLSSGSSDIKMSAHEVLVAAIARARSEGVDLRGKYFESPGVRATTIGTRLEWAVTWSSYTWDSNKRQSLTEFARVLVDDRTGRTEFESGVKK